MSREYRQSYTPDIQDCPIYAVEFERKEFTDGSTLRHSLRE